MYQPPNKVYTLVHDGANVLIGQEGFSWNKKKQAAVQRQGWHLPGGTVDAKETTEGAATRELAEEMGIALPLTSGNTTAFVHKTAGNVTFLVHKVASVPDLIKARKPPVAAKKNDQPFAKVDAQPITDCVTGKGVHFDGAFGNDWFFDGIEQANNQGLLK